MIDRLHVLHVPGADPERDEIVHRIAQDVEVCLHLDPNRNGIMPNWLTAVSCAGDDSTKWSVIVQDDALPLRGWRQHLDEVLLFTPEPITGLTYFGQFTEPVVRRGIPFIVGPHLIWGGAVAYHSSILRDLWRWASKVYSETGYQHDDRLVSAYAEKIGHQTALVTRALFDQPVERSLVGHAGSSRRPSITIVSDGPASLIRWGSTPRSVQRRSGSAPDQRKWLVTYGTPDQPTDHTFVKMRSGAVKRVVL